MKTQYASIILLTPNFDQAIAEAWSKFDNLKSIEFLGYTRPLGNHAYNFQFDFHDEPIKPKSVNWLLETGTFEENLETIKEIITNQGMQYYICNNLPFNGNMSFETSKGISCQIQERGYSIYDRTPMFAYGSLQLIKRLQKSNLSVVTFCNFDQFKCSYYYPRFGCSLLQRNYAFIPFGELTRRKDWILSTIGKEGQVFIRPDDGFKTFTGQLVSAETWDKDIARCGFYDVPPECMCVVAEPRNILNEYRFVIGTDYPSDDYPQRIISGSCYKRNGFLVDNPNDEIEKHILEYVEAVLRETDYRPDPFWTLDICTTKNGDYQTCHVLEVGSMSCAGLYGCDLNKVFGSLSNYLEAEWLEMAEPKTAKPIAKDAFDEFIEKFRSKKIDICDWNWCVSRHSDKNYGAFIMGTGAEQCLASKWGFSSEQEIRELYNSLGVSNTSIIWI